MSKTQQAIELVAGGMSQYQAAKEIGINRATLSRAIRSQEEVCWCVLYENRTWKAYPTKREAEDALSIDSDKPLYMIQVRT